MAAPFLKWAGGKARLAARVLAVAPVIAGRYYEPFLGGGAVFFAFEAAGRAREATLADANPELVGCFTAVRDEPEALIARIEALAQPYLAAPPAERPDLYYAVRAANPEAPLDRAARLIFLNKTCYNGLYRVNGQGRFNVPHGRYARPSICDAAGIRAASVALQGASLCSNDFEAACATARAGDLVYFDPPYQPLSSTARFTGYTAADFGPADQERLRDLFEALTRRGVAAILSNSDHPAIHALYGERGYTTEVVPMSRAINSARDRRAPVPELLISNLAHREVAERMPVLSATLSTS